MVAFVALSKLQVEHPAQDEKLATAKDTVDCCIFIPCQFLTQVAENNRLGGCLKTLDR